MSDHTCPFCKIISLEMPAKILYQDELVTAFYDIRPMTPVHILIVPNRHIESVNEVEEQDQAAMGRLFWVAGQLAMSHGINQSGYRLVVNTGPHASQSVFHVHMHLIGGQRMPFRLD